MWLSVVGEDRSLNDISAQDTRIHPGYELRLEDRNVLNSDGKDLSRPYRSPCARIDRTQIRLGTLRFIR